MTVFLSFSKINSIQPLSPPPTLHRWRFRPVSPDRICSNFHGVGTTLCLSGTLSVSLPFFPAVDVYRMSQNKLHASRQGVGGGGHCSPQLAAQLSILKKKSPLSFYPLLNLLNVLKVFFFLNCIWDKLFLICYKWVTSLLLLQINHSWRHHSQ